MAGDGDRILSEDRLRGVLDLFERLRERPAWRWRERLRPLLLLLGPERAASHAAEMLKSRCEDERAPVSHIAAATPASDVAGVLREAKRELSQPSSRARGEPALRFPLLEMALWLRDLREIRLAGDRPPPRGASSSERENHLLVRRLTHPPVGDNENARRRELNRVIRRRGRDVLRDLEEVPGRRATFLSFLEQIAPIGIAVVALISAGTAAALDLASAVFAAVIGLAFVTVQIVARTRGWYGVRRFGWFLRQPYVDRDSTGFLGFALGVFDPRPVEPDDHGEQLDLLLVAAFLEDLRRNYRRDYRRAAWARVRYPVLIFEHLSAGHPGVAFVELAERVRADGQASGRLPGFDPLIVVAGVDPAAPAGADPSGPRLLERLARAVRVDVASDEPQSVIAARGLWDRYTREQRRLGALGSRRELRVDITRDPGGDLPPVRPVRRRPRLAHPALPWIAMVAVAAASVSVISVQVERYCSPFDIRRMENGECVGITDGSYRFGKDSGGKNNDNRLNKVLHQIESLNDHVMESGTRYATVVYLGPVTADPAIKNKRIDLLAGVQGELIGLAMAQKRFNDAAEGDDLRLRVLVANAGAKFRYAEDVAEQIRARALKDRTIVAVIGFEQSRRQTQQAIKLLAKSALPLIGTANSFDGTALLEGDAGYSPYYFRLASPNARTARHAAYWARRGDVGGRKADDAVVIYDGDEDDVYSANLAADFQRSFRPGKALMRPYRDPGELNKSVREVCQKRQPDLFYYAGRSDEFRSFINVLELFCPKEPKPLVLADDEIAKYVSDNAGELGRRGTFDLYFTPLAAREAWTRRWIGDQPLQPFYSDYDPALKEMTDDDDASGQRPSITRAAVSYDAATLLATVASRVYWQERALPSAGSVFAALNDPDHDVLPKGASGALRFGPRSGGHQVVDRPVILATIQRDGTTQVTQVCGRLVPGGPGGADCPPEDEGAGAPEK
ncbi:ABC transporter substrate-binding protein [Actinomadura luteofluorescens]|uniref:ABC transporter substrate-binding protein n=1 Tax=Actinomadura luteofluorescens TaxID=46163 RepID=UPI0030CECC02